MLKRAPFMIVSVCPLLAAAAILLLPSGQVSHDVRAQSVDQQPQPLHVVLDDVTTLLDKAGRPVPVRVRIANWAVAAHQRTDSFPKQGFLVVELFAGTLTAIIDGKSTRRVDGETFTVPSHARLGIEAGGDTATFQIIEITRQSK